MQLDVLSKASSVRTRTASSRYSSFSLPHFVILHDALQHRPGILKDVQHALEKGDAHNAEK